jgi:hypothetical protein
LYYQHCFFLTLHPLFLIHFGIQLVVLVLVVRRSRAAKVATRIWALLLLMGAVAHWVSVLSSALAHFLEPEEYPGPADKLTVLRVLRNIVALYAGYWFFRFAPRLDEQERL